MTEPGPESQEGGEPAVGDERLRAMSPEERRAFCGEVLAGLSDLVEGTAPEDFRARVEAVLGQCRPYLAYRNTLAATIDLTRGLSAAPELPSPEADEALDRCRERVREELRKRRQA